MLNQSDEYYVIDQSRVKHGPATKATLQQWANQGRVLANTKIVNSAGQEFVATDVLPQCFLNHPHPHPAQNPIPNPNPAPNSNASQGPNMPPAPGTYVAPPGTDPDALFNAPYTPKMFSNNRNAGYDAFNSSNQFVKPSRKRFMGLGSYGYQTGGTDFLGWGIAGVLLACCCNVMFAIIVVFFAHGYHFRGKPGGKFLLIASYLNAGLQLGLTVWWKIHH